LEGAAAREDERAIEEAIDIWKTLTLSETMPGGGAADGKPVRNPPERDWR
jgi:hypothetical protein